MKSLINTIRLITTLWLFYLVSSTPVKINCPKNIKVFAAFPLNEQNNRKYYYECSQHNEAILKSCKNGDIYHPEVEACGKSDIHHSSIDYSPRVKRQADLNPAIQENTKAIVNQKTIGRNVRLGALYYGTNDEVHVNENLWDDTSLNDTWKRTINAPSTAEVKISQDKLDRVNNFDIDAALKLSFMAGLVQVDGSARYLSEKREKTNSVVVSYFYEYRTLSESTTQEIELKLGKRGH